VNIKPRYDQKAFDANGRKNKWQVVVSPDDKDGGVWINQDAQFALADLEAGKEISFTPKFSGSGVYIFVIDGEITIDNRKVGKRDAVGVYDTNVFSITANQQSALLAIEIPMLQ